MKVNKEIIKVFYKAFNSEHQTEIEDIINKTVIKDWKSYGSNDEYRPGGSTAFVTILNNFHMAIPDLKWDIKAILEVGNILVVRSKASGTPNDIFLGVKPSGKSFEIMTIDIHTIDNGKIVETFHCEDWMVAVKQFAVQ